MILTVRALRHMPEPAGEIAGDLTDAFFADLDSSLREMGVGDTVVPKRMKKLASSFFGRTDAYHGPLDAADEDRLMVALARNVVGEEGASSHALARYALAAERNLRHSSVDAFMNQGVPFPQPETFTEATS
jgi:cytochrome b pre-mRNA-processing protein 3